MFIQNYSTNQLPVELNSVVLTGSFLAITYFSLSYLVHLNVLTSEFFFIFRNRDIAAVMQIEKVTSMNVINAT